MIDPKDGALTTKDPSFKIGPALTRFQFRSADWGHGATTVVVNEPWHSWKLDGHYCSMSLSFSVVLYFYGEQLVQIHMCISDEKFGKSWADYSSANEQRRKESHDAWVSACLGTQRSFAWGTVVSNDGEDEPHGAAGATILITYSAFPASPSQSQRGGSSAVKPDGYVAVASAQACVRADGPDSSPTARPPNLAQGMPTELPSPRRIRRRRVGNRRVLARFVYGALIAAACLFMCEATLQIPIALIAATYGTPIVAELDGSKFTDTSDFIFDIRVISHSVGYQYSFQGEPHKAVEDVSQDVFAVAQPGQQVPARAMRFGRPSAF
jgi:hypothetical protein